MRNIGSTDRITRIALAFGLMYWAMTPTGPTLAAGYAGMVLLASGLIGWCPFYMPLGINTAKKQ
jgi:hypothetical protein